MNYNDMTTEQLGAEYERLTRLTMSTGEMLPSGLMKLREGVDYKACHQQRYQIVLVARSRGLHLGPRPTGKDVIEDNETDDTED